MKLARYELDAVVDTIIEQIKDSKNDSPEQIAYQELVKSRKDVTDELIRNRKQFNLELLEKYSKLYPKLNFYVDDYNKVTCVRSVEEPKQSVDRNAIERELIVSNIKGNVDDTIKTIVEKYTK